MYRGNYNAFFNALTISERKECTDIRNSKDHIEKLNIDDIILKDSFISYNNLIEKLNIERLSLDDYAYLYSDHQFSIDNTKLNNLLKESEWYKILKEIESEYKGNSSQTFSTDSFLYSLNFFFPWVVKKLNITMESLKNIKIDLDQKKIMIESIAHSVSNIYIKTFIYEYHKQNEKKLKKFNENNFSNINEILQYYNKYPVILRRIITKLNFIVKYFDKSLRDIDENLHLINKALGGDIGKIIKGFKCSLGDTHSNGCSVLMYEFENKKIIYKPKNLTISKKYYEVINLLNSKSNAYLLPIAKAYYNDEYTVEEMIENKECSTLNEVKGFYRRFGKTIGITYILRGNDFHHENIISCGEYPYIIDLETLFQQGIRARISINNAIDKANRYLLESVLSMCAVPIKESSKDVDVSALSYKEITLRNQLVLNDDKMKYEYIDIVAGAEKNIPKYQGQSVGYEEYIDDILLGFKETLSVVEENKEAFLDLLKEDKNIITRQLFKNTSVYYKFIQFASHPKYTSDMRQLEKMVSNLWAYNYLDGRIVVSEERDIINDDVPIFYSQIGSKDIIDGNGYIIENYYEKSNLELVIERIQLLNKEEIEKELDLLISSFYAKYKEVDKEILINKFKKCEKNKLNDLSYAIDKRSLIEDIVDSINKTCISFNGYKTWISANKTKDDLIIKILDGTISKGILGVVYVFDKLVKSTYMPKYIKEFNIIRHSITEEFNRYIYKDDLTSIIDFIDVYESFNSLVGKEVDNLDLCFRLLQDNISNNKYNIDDLCKIIIVFDRLYKDKNKYKYKKIIVDISTILLNFIKSEEIELNNFNVSKINLALYICNEYIKDKELATNLELIEQINVTKLLDLEKCNNSLELEECVNYIKYNIKILENFKTKIDERLVSNIIINKLTSTKLLCVRLNLMLDLYEYNKDINLMKHIEVIVEKIIDDRNYFQEYPILKMNYFYDLCFESGLLSLLYAFIRYNNLEREV